MRYISFLSSSTTPIVLAATLLTTTPSTHAQALVPGEILLNNSGGNNIQLYSSSGAFLKDYAGSGTFWQGASVTPNGNLVTTFRDNPGPGVNIFSPSGAQIASFATPAVGRFGPGDISVFADGTLAISDQSDTSGAILLYSQDGTLKTSLAPAGLIDPIGSTIGSDNTLWVADQSGASDALFHLAESGTLLSRFSLGFSPGDLVVDPTNGTLWVADRNDNIVHLDQTNGNTLDSFSIGMTGNFLGIGISPDGNTLYATTTSSAVVEKFNTSGLTTGRFNIVTPSFPAFLTVVPLPNSNAAPEPGTLSLLTGLYFPISGIVLSRRQKNKRCI